MQTSFLFYGGVTTLFLTYFSIRFAVFDGTLGRTLVGNLAFIGFTQIPGGAVLFWTYQILAVAMLAAASMTAFQDAQATEWRDVAIGEVPETITFVASVIIMLLVRGQTTVAVPFYGVGVFVPIAVMALAVRKHVLQHFSGRARTLSAAGAAFAAALAGVVFIGQLVGKWHEGGWIALVSFSTLGVIAHLVLLSPSGYRGAGQVHRIVRDKARVQGAMASIVEWQSFKMQEYRFRLLLGIASFLELFGVGQMAGRRPALALAGAYRSPVKINETFLASSFGAAPERVEPSAAPANVAEKRKDLALEHYHLPPRIMRHRIIVPVNAVHQGTLTALRYAHSLSSDVTAVHIEMDAAETETLKRKWETWGEGVRLVVLASEHGMLLEPLLIYIQGIIAGRQHNETITIVVPQSIRPRWWSNLTRTQMAVLLRLSMPFETGVVITDVPYQLDESDRS